MAEPVAGVRGDLSMHGVWLSASGEVNRAFAFLPEGAQTAPGIARAEATPSMTHIQTVRPLAVSALSMKDGRVVK